MRTEKLKIVKNVLGRSYKSGTEYLFYCPYCSHDKMKMSVNVSNNVWKCWICDRSGRNIGTIIRKFGAIDDKVAWSKFENRVETTEFDTLFTEKEEEIAPKVDLPKEFNTLTGTKRSSGALSAKLYLRNRGIGKPDILKWKIGYASSGEYEGRIMVPSFAPDGSLSYFVARSYGKAWPRYKNPHTSRDIVFNDLYIDWDKDIILVEGVFDAIKAGNAIPLLGSTLRKNSKLFQKIAATKKEIYLALDPDAKKKTDSITNLFSRFGVDVYQIDVSGYEDVGEMTKAEFKKRKKEASILETDDYLLEKVLAI
jgi:DNA primase